MAESAGNVKIVTHPEYDKRLADYKYHRDHFEGGKDYALRSDDYIPKHEVEDKTSYEARKKRAVYINYCEAVISIYQSAIWKASPVRKLSSSVEDIVDDIDRLGTSANDFFQAVTEQAQAIGLHFVWVDAPVREEGKTYTKEEAAKLNLRPFAVGVAAENVKAWDIEFKDPARVGQFNYLVIEEFFYSAPSPFVAAKAITQMRVLKPDSWELYQKEGTGYKLIDDGVNSIGEVAVIPFYGRRKGFMKGESDLKNIAPLAQKIAEWMSMLDEDMNFHALRQLVIKTNAEITELGIGSNRAIRLMPDDGEDAFVLESVGNASVELWASIMKLQDLIYRLATNQIAAVKDTAQVESAEKKKLDMTELESLLNKKAASFEQSELAVWRLMSKFAGSEKEDINVEYHREFSITERTLEEWKEYIGMGILSVLDLVMDEHTTVDSEEDAKEILKKNLALRKLINDKVGLGDLLKDAEGKKSGEDE